MSNEDEDSFGLADVQQEEQREILYRLDERTERIDSRLERIDRRVESQESRLSKHDDRIQRNTTIINAVTFGIGSFVTALFAKLNGLIRF